MPDDKIFRPMLSATLKDCKSISSPILASPKIDGVRCLAMGGGAKSRTMKDIPNRYIQGFFEKYANVLEGMDGELIVGAVAAPNVYNATVSGVMREAGEPDFHYYVFDMWNSEKTFIHRLADLGMRASILNDPTIHVVPHTNITNTLQLQKYEDQYLKEGYEGIILRGVNTYYKQGRSTLKEGGMMKLKRFEDAEATIVGFEELHHNANAAFTNEVGRTARSTHKDNQIPMGTLGALVVRGLTAYKDVTFHIGSGFDDETRRLFWNNREHFMGKIVKFKHLTKGALNAPRHPIYLGMRYPIDVDIPDLL